MAQALCHHCGEVIPAGTDIHWQYHGEQQSFCCHACRAISQTIQENRLDDYYLLRDGGQKPADTPVDDIWSQPGMLQRWATINNDNSASISLYIEGMHCTACAWLIEKYLGRQPGVQQASVNFEQSRLDVTWQVQQLPLGELAKKISDIGYLAHPYQSDIVRERQQQENRALLKRIGITGILMMQIGMFSIALYAGDYLGISEQHRQLLRVFSMMFALPLLYYGALPFFSSAFYSLRQRQLNINLSISLAISGLYGSSIYSVFSQRGDIYFDSAAMFCLFILTARYIEKKSRSDLTPPRPLLPALVLRLRDGESRRCAVEDIEPGDTVLVAEGEMIAVDGVVCDGESSVSEAFINGESAAIRKQPGDVVYAGSQNHDGRLTITVSHRPEQSLLHQISRLSQLAAEEKPLFISITDRIAGRFTLIIFSLTALTWLYWQAIDTQRAFWVALSVLVVSCPCALSLAAPAALSSVHYRLRQLGVFIRNSRVLENLNRVNHVVFDKTGTLTAGHYRLQQVVTGPATEKSQALAIATAMERYSRHPLARAFAGDSTLTAEQVQIVANAGIEASVAGERYRIGSPDFLEQWHGQLQLPDTQQQWLVLGSRQQLLAYFSVADALRDEAPAVVQQLKNQNIKTEILSGDSSPAVEEVARALGITQFYKAMSSAGKLAHLKQLQQQGRLTLMIGDGINDAPVLAQSDVSATLLEASDLVKNSADMVLLGNRLDGILAAFDSARRYRRILIQNFVWAFSYNLLAIPFAMAGFVAPWMAAAGMSLSSVIVVLNSRRLASANSSSTTAAASQPAPLPAAGGA